MNLAEACQKRRADHPRPGATILSLLLVLCCCIMPAAGAEEDEFISLPGSERRYTMARINDFFQVPDWYPQDHLPMPEVVSRGARPAVFACASCHLTSGSGHPESGALAGLPVDYQVRQMKAYQRFQRPSIAGVMINIARAMTEEQMQEAAEYFAAQPPLPVQQVREVKEVPVTYVNSRFMRLAVEPGTVEKEPIGERLITVPLNEYRVRARDPYGTFITYVPEGTLEAGRRLVSRGRDGAAPCTSCHGPALQGTAVAPLIAGQHANYLRAQLRAYKEGVRRGAADPGQVMAENMKYFSDREILATAAYVASLPRR